jgi:hypothetical protein
MNVRHVIGLAGLLALTQMPHASPVYAPELPFIGGGSRLGLIRFSGKELNNPGEPGSRPFAERKERRTQRWRRRKAR